LILLALKLNDISFFFEELPVPRRKQGNAAIGIEVLMPSDRHWFLEASASPIHGDGADKSFGIFQFTRMKSLKASNWTNRSSVEGNTMAMDHRSGGSKTYDESFFKN
jgi:hypothetical protein